VVLTPVLWWLLLRRAEEFVGVVMMVDPVLAGVE
jgi:hypothetical protein